MFLEAQHIVKRYANHLAVDDVSILVEKGHVFGLLGPNGAGKTSLIRIINRITMPDEGKVLLDGQLMQPSDVTKIGYLPEERGLYRKMKVGEHAIYLAMLKGLSRKEAVRRIKQWFDQLEITSWWEKKVEELSKGMQQKIQFICSVIHEPELLILDEPFSGFDPVNADILKREILKLRDKGVTIIFSTHNMQSVEEICDEISLINKSKVVLSGKVDEVRDRYSHHIMRIDIDPLTPISGEFLSNVDATEITYGKNCLTLRIPRPNNLNNRDFIESFPKGINILRFEEEKPSMHDIFVKMVGNTEVSKSEN